MNDDTKADVLCCPAGWKVVNKDSKDTRASCERCTTNTFTITHSQDTCEAQTECGKGQKISAFSTSVKGTCESCGSYSSDPKVPNRFMDVPKHREIKCKTQVTCGVGQKYVEPDGSRASSRSVIC